MVRPAWPWAVLLAAVSWNTPVGAQAVEPIRVRYTAPPDCPSDAELGAQIVARTSMARLAQPAELARVFEVAISRESDGDYLGSLTARDRNGAVVSIRASGACAEVVRALSYIAAMIVDPAARLELPTEYTLPDNPYWQQLAALDTRSDESAEARLRVNPYRSEPVGVAPRHNPYPSVWTTPSDPMRRPNPYR